MFNHYPWRRRRNPVFTLAKFILVTVILAIALIISLFYQACLHSPAFRVVITMATLFFLGVLCMSPFSSDSSILKKVSSLFWRKPWLSVPLFLCIAFGTFLGWRTVIQEFEEQKKIEEERISRLNEEERFQALSSQGHLEAAKNAMNYDYDSSRKVGGNLVEAERHIHAISKKDILFPEASKLADECNARRIREELLEIDSNLTLSRLQGTELLTKLEASLSQVKMLIQKDNLQSEKAVIEILEKKIKHRYDTELLSLTYQAIDQNSYKQAEEYRQKISKDYLPSKEAHWLRRRIQSGLLSSKTKQAVTKNHTGSTPKHSTPEPSPSDQSLLCCDGTISPSCSCHGPHRGCCSHHSGVCGCN